MKNQSIQVICSFSDKGDVQEILLKSFRLYLSRILAGYHDSKI